MIEVHHHVWEPIPLQMAKYKCATCDRTGYRTKDGAIVEHVDQSTKRGVRITARAAGTYEPNLPGGNHRRGLRGSHAGRGGRGR